MEDKENKVSDLLKKETTRRGFLRTTAVAAGSAVTLATIGNLAVNSAQAQTKPAEAPKKEISKYLFVERQNCTGCRACEYACSVFHTGIVRPSVARIHVMKYKDVIDVPVICWHCDDHPCIEACPTTPKAIKVDPKTNGIILDEKICLGAKCHKCVEACPAKFVRANPDTGKPLMCDMCGGDPECVKACLAQSGDPQGPCLLANQYGFGVNMAYRAVTPEQAGADLLELTYYPNVDGKRVAPAKAGKAKKARR